MAGRRPEPQISRPGRLAHRRPLRLFGSSPVAELRLGPVCGKPSTIRCCAVAAFARVARQITGCSPATSYLGELLDERRAVMEVELVMTCSRKGSQTQFTPELGPRLSA
jgi:hypothetical protein